LKQRQFLLLAFGVAMALACPAILRAPTGWTVTTSFGNSFNADNA